MDRPPSRAEKLSVPYIHDLIELSGIASNTVYSAANGTILGVIDGATYTGDNDNTLTTIVELNDTKSSTRYLTINGVNYRITLAVPGGSANPVTLTSASGAVTNVTGNGHTSQIAFIRADPVSGVGPTRYFAVLDDSVGNLNIATLQTRTLDFDPDGSDVKINVSANNDINTETGDRLTGTSGADSLTGGGGNDAIWGLDGNDTLIGGTGNDTLYGGAGNDRLDGGPGNDMLNGGDGLDTLFGGTGDDCLLGWRGNDLLVGGDGNDQLEGGEGDDTLYGDDAGDTRAPSGGDDNLQGGDGNDVIFGGGGNDYIDGGDGHDIADGGAGDDRIDGGAGNDTLTGGAGNDQLNGGAGNDRLTGDEGNDSLNGGDGDDTLHGGAGSDTLTGGAGNDVFRYTPDGSIDTITDFNFGNTGALNDGNRSNNDFIDLSPYYHKLWDLRADFADDGILNQSNTKDMKGRPITYDGRSSLLVDGQGGIEFLGVTWRDFTAENTGVPCFTRGSRIMTPAGEVPVEDLVPGDLVMTLDAGPQPLLWTGHRALTEAELRASPHLAPITIAAGALGEGLPRRDLTVSPQHRVLVRSRIAQRMFGRHEVLVAAKHLLGAAGVTVAARPGPVEYWHIMFDRHQIVLSEGATTESLFVGREAFKSLTEESRREIIELLPQLRGGVPAPARPLVGGRPARSLIARHMKNAVALCEMPV